MLGLVGKGITFDTGGISLKPSDGMERMKDDMAGGATVIAALRAIALEKLPIRAMAVVPCTENMPGGRATKPGDVHTGASGITVEINNTDAEGRLILGDALWYAKQLGATHLVDVATLTGRLRRRAGQDDDRSVRDRRLGRGRSAAPRPGGGEKVWPMPLFEEYREPLKSEIADMLNSPGRPAGAITAAMFLKEFVGPTPWAHLDIAGTAWAEEAKPWMPKGATGVMIRTLVEVARTGGSELAGSRVERASGTSGGRTWHHGYRHLMQNVAPLQPITPTIIEVINGADRQHRHDPGRGGRVRADRRDHGRGGGRRAARRRAVHLVSPPAAGHDDRSARRRAQLLPRLLTIAETATPSADYAESLNRRRPLLLAAAMAALPLSERR